MEGGPCSSDQSVCESWWQTAAFSRSGNQDVGLGHQGGLQGECLCLISWFISCSLFYMNCKNVDSKLGWRETMSLVKQSNMGLKQNWLNRRALCHCSPCRSSQATPQLWRPCALPPQDLPTAMVSISCLVLHMIDYSVFGECLALSDAVL